VTVRLGYGFRTVEPSRELVEPSPERFFAGQLADRAERDAISGFRIAALCFE
jgi:hypothetical protein